MVGLRVVSVRRERMLPAAPPLVTLPIVLIALLKFSEFAVHLFKARDGSSTSYFRFSPRAVLQVRDDGDWCWREGSERWRREIAPFLARAEALLAEGGDDVLSAGGNWLESYLSRLGGLYVGSVLVELDADGVEDLRSAVQSVDAQGLEVRIAPSIDAPGLALPDLRPTRETRPWGGRPNRQCRPMSDVRKLFFPAVVLKVAKPRWCKRPFTS